MLPGDGSLTPNHAGTEKGSTVTNRFSLSSLLLTGLVALLLWPASPQRAAGQQQASPPLPRNEYYGVFRDVYRGEYQSAGRGLRSLSRSAYRDSNGYFLDSVCYWTMMGECLYRIGDYGAAIEQYEAALNLYSGLQNWPTRITNFPGEIQEDRSATRRSVVPWGASARGARPGKFDRSLLIFMGKTDAENEAAIRNGGVVDLKRLRSIDMTEIMRCAALAAYRRYMLKGPTCKIDPFTKQLSTSLAGQGGSTIATAYQGVTRGMVLASLEDWANARTVLSNSLKIGGFEHPLTPIAMIMLGHIAARNDQLDMALQYYMEASYVAAAYEQFDMIEEALHHAAVVHGAGRTGRPFEPAAIAAGWAKKENADPLQVSLLVDAASSAVEAGDTGTADAALARARQAMRGTDLPKSALQTRWLYASALNLFVQQDVAAGEKAFADFLKHARGTSRWLYQIALADAAVRGNKVTDRDSEMLYEVLLDEPTDRDWLFRPEETMAFLATPHFEPMERWFEIALSRKADEQAIEIAELIRRQRFFSGLAMGGRLVSLRWILEAPDAALTDTARLQKKDMLVRYPDWKNLAAEAERIRGELEKLPVDPEVNSDERTAQKRLIDQLQQISTAQEIFLRQICLMREPGELAFPRRLKIPDIQQGLKPNQLMVSFLRIGDVYHIMTLGNARYLIEGSVPARDLDRRILDLLRQIGVTDKGAILDADVLLDPQWKTTARELAGLIFQKSDARSLSEIEELIVVPDNKVWYLPVELLQYGSGEQTRNILDVVRIRYAPMASLGVPDERSGRRFQRRAVVPVRNFSRDPAGMIGQGVADLQSAMPDLAEITRTFQGPSALLISTIDQLFVWHDHKDAGSRRDGPLGLAPMQVDSGQPGSTLFEWMALPWQGIDQFVWTGLSTDVEGNTRNRADGSELFFGTTALMASGTRTILLSRWRVGGRSTLDLTREFAIELNRLPADEAWQRSVQLFQEADLDLESEPRVRPVELEQPLTGESPFFWAGYMLLDNGWDPTAGPGASGQPPGNPDAEPAEPAEPLVRPDKGG